MKKIKYIQDRTMIIALLLATTWITSCSQDGWENRTESAETSATSIVSISVNDGGYTSAKGTGTTRTTDNDETYATTFITGDKIGLFAKHGEDKEFIKDLCLVASEENGLLVWKKEDGNLPALSAANASYYAYYPYNNNRVNMGGCVDSENTWGESEATAFFKEGIKIWKETIETDQSDHDKYTAQDFMIAKGTVDANSGKLTFAMQHQMGLAVIDLSQKTGNDEVFVDFKPYKGTKEGIYRYIVAPEQDKTLSGNYTNADGKTAHWTLTANFATGTYNTYTIKDKGEEPEQPTVKVGDYYLSNGQVVADLTNLPDGVTCIGIVLWTGDPTLDDPTLKTDHPDCTHGLVLALTEYKSAWKEPNAADPYVGDWATDNGYESITSTTKGENLTKIRGYNNTKAIEGYNQANIETPVMAISETLVPHRAKYIAPESECSNWFLPSAQELNLMYGVADIINKAMESVPETVPISIAITKPDGYATNWESTETQILVIYNASKPTLMTRNKDIKHYYRPVLAF